MNFRSGAYHFHKLPKNPFRSITILHFLPDFAVPETIIFKISLISTRSSPPTAAAQRVRQRRGLAAVPEIRIFKRSAAQRVSGRSRRFAFSSVRQRRGLAAVPEPRIFTLKTAQARSGALHFRAQNGLSSFRRPPFSRSTGSSFRSPCHFFTLPWHIPTKTWGEYPPPPPGFEPLFN